MDTKSFIKIGDTRIKLSNIKNFGISGRIRTSTKDIGDYCFHRKIWLKKSSMVGGLFIHRDDEWNKYVDLDSLIKEYKDVKSTASLKKGEILSEQVAVINSNADIAYTKGRLYFNGKFFHCEGTPYTSTESLDSEDPLNFDKFYDSRYQFIESYSADGKSYDKYTVFHPRSLADMNHLVSSDELAVIKFEPKKIIEKTDDDRYLYITTYQNDNFQFYAKDYGIDSFLQELDNNLT